MGTARLSLSPWKWVIDSICMAPMPVTHTLLAASSIFTSGPTISLRSSRNWAKSPVTVSKLPSGEPVSCRVSPRMSSPLSSGRSGSRRTCTVPSQRSRSSRLRFSMRKIQASIERALRSMGRAGCLGSAKPVGLPRPKLPSWPDAAPAGGLVPATTGPRRAVGPTDTEEPGEEIPGRTRWGAPGGPAGATSLNHTIRRAESWTTISRLRK